MVIYDKDKLDDNIHIQKKTPNPQIYMLCEMGSELEGIVDGIIGGVGTVGSDLQPVKLVDGVCEPVANPLVDAVNDQDVNGIKNFLDNPKGATAESGAVDTSLINANWASQTGDGKPNNLLHDMGNEIARGTKQGHWCGFSLGKPIANTEGKWLRFCQFAGNYSELTIIEVLGNHGNNGFHYGRAIVSGVGNYTRFASLDNEPLNSGMKFVAVGNLTTNLIELWLYVTSIDDINNTAIYCTTREINTVTIFNQEYDNLCDVSIGDTFGRQLYIVGVE